MAVNPITFKDLKLHADIRTLLADSDACCEPLGTGDSSTLSAVADRFTVTPGSVTREINSHLHDRFDKAASRRGVRRASHWGLPKFSRTSLR